MTVKYLQLPPWANPPDISALRPFRSVVVIDDEVSPDWQHLVSVWLVKSGCLYMMAWGKHCSTWDDSVDLANFVEFKPGEIPDDKFVMTTWHENESLNDVFWYAKHNAFHSIKELTNTLILHVSNQNNQQRFLESYANA